MTGLRTFVARLRGWMGRSARDAALAEEMDHHLEMLAADFRARGLSDDDARRRARREFGSVDDAKERARDQQGFPWVESLWQDTRFALRQLRRAPLFTAAAVLTLAVGIGGTAGVFSVLDAVAIRTLPYPDADRLVVIHEGLPRSGPFPASAADADFWMQHATSFDRMALLSPEFMNLTGSGDPERLVVGAVSPTLLPLLGARASAGRLLRSRRREMAVRAALGAGRWRLVRQIFVENLVLGVLGGAAGLVVAVGVLRAIVWLAPPDVPRLDDVALDARVLAFSSIVSIGAGVVIGLPSAWRLGTGDLRAWLASRTAEAGTQRASYSALVVCEIAACAACVAVALLLTASLRELKTVNKGFDSGRILTIGVNLPASRYATPAQQDALVGAVADDLRGTPGVAAVAVSTQLPLTGTGSLSSVSVDGGTTPPMERPSADVRSVSPDYFHVVQVPLLRGRLLDPHDRDRLVAVLSARLAARGWPGQDPIGRRFRLGLNPANPLYEVVGVAGDVRGTALDQPETPTAYVPFPQRARGIFTVMVKTEGDPARMTGPVRDILRAHDPRLPLPAIRTMEDVVEGSLEARQFQLTVVTVFALLAVLLSGIGIYSVMAYSVTQRRNELGLRLALGAQPRALMLLVIGRAARLALLGLAIAVPVGWAAGSAVRSFLYGVTPFHPPSMGLTAVAVLCIAIGAAAMPAIRAGRLEPGVALRHE
jgi:predicted permease